MPGMAAKRNYDPSRASAGCIGEPDTGAAGRGDRAALPGCADAADWRAGAVHAAPNGCTWRCNTCARDRSASKGRTSPRNPRADKTVAPEPSHAPPCLSQAGLDNGAVSCQLRPVCFGHLLDTKGDDIGASTVGAVGAFPTTASCPPYSVLMIGRNRASGADDVDPRPTAQKKTLSDD